MRRSAVLPDWVLPVAVLAPLGLVVGMVTARSRAAWLDRLVLEPGEEVVADEPAGHVRLRIPARRSTMAFPGAVVRLTTRRLVVAQRVLWSRRHLVRLVFFHHGEVPAADREAGPFKSYNDFQVDPAGVRVERGPRGEPRATLLLRARPILEDPMLFDVELEVASPRAEELARVLTDVV